MLSEDSGFVKYLRKRGNVKLNNSQKMFNGNSNWDVTRVIFNDEEIGSEFQNKDHMVYFEGHVPGVDYNKNGKWYMNGLPVILSMKDKGYGLKRTDSHSNIPFD